MKERLKKEPRNIEEMIYSYIRIEFDSCLSRYKGGNLGLSILDILNDSLALISKYAGKNVSIQRIVLANYLFFLCRLFCIVLYLLLRRLRRKMLYLTDSC